MKAPALLGAEPQLFVCDIAAACAFYAQKLGFAIAFTAGTPAFYAQVVRDGVKLNLRAVAPLPVDAALRDRERLLAASITVTDADALFEEFAAAGAVFAEGLVTQEWGARTFVVRDPDGNQILFAA